MKLLFQEVDIAPLAIFRVVFGLLVTAESWGAILTGWVGRNFIEPTYHFPFIPFSFLEPLPGNGMYFYFFAMGLSGIFIMLGFRYRLSIIVFALMWTTVYLMQKTSYNNHYYLLMLLSWMMCMVPAAGSLSLDARRNPELRRDTCKQWHLWIFALQITIVYMFAAIAKMYPDWLQGIPVKIFFSAKSHYFLVGPLLQKEWFIMLVSYSGIAFDLLIAPALMWRRTRKYAFIASIFFHLFNSVIFQVGIFPYLGIAFAIFFFPPARIRTLFLRKSPHPKIATITSAGKRERIVTALLVVYFIIQLLLPLRHHLFPGNVHWTEEGHRLSWHMMLRAKSGTVLMKIRNGDKEWIINPKEYLTDKQVRRISCHPDMLWQFVQILKDELAKEGIMEPEIYAVGSVSLNGRMPSPLYNPEVNLAGLTWKPFQHSEWLVPLH